MPKKKPDTFSSAAAVAKTRVATDGPEKGNLVDRKIAGIGKADQDARRQILWVEPSECQLWELHNRNFERLNEDNCRDLIEGFLSEGEQTTPAIVRRVAKRGQVRYEIIAGARRYWTVNWLRENNYPDFRFLIDVRDLDDEHAFRVSNSENLDRLDISDYERALDYKRALDLYYRSQADMAKRLEKTEAWLSRYLTLAEVPVQIANAYVRWHDLKVRHAPELLKLLNDKTLNKKLLKEATRLHMVHLDNERRGKPPMTGIAVKKQLLSVASKPRRRGGPVREYEKDGKVHMSLKTANRHGLNLYIPHDSSATNEDLIRAFRSCLKEYRKT